MAGARGGGGVIGAGAGAGHRCKMSQQAFFQVGCTTNSCKQQGSRQYPMGTKCPFCPVQHGEGE